MSFLALTAESLRNRDRFMVEGTDFIFKIIEIVGRKDHAIRFKYTSNDPDFDDTLEWIFDFNTPLYIDRVNGV